MSLKKLGRYDLVRVLGKGAMGLVYEGRDPNLDRRVAIKTIKVENLSDESAAEYEVRFRTEARSAARLQHPNIVSVYDSDRDGDIAFLVMEFIQGDDLKHHLDKGERYTLEQSQRIMADLLSALDYAHRQNIVHRDIKPANLLIEPDGRVKLADFGVARIQDSGEATRTQGTIVGTLKYMSPEQLQGRPIDARADLYAAGVVLYQLLTGKRPFDGDTDFAVIQQIVNHTPPAATYYNDRLPPAIDAVVARALAKSRDQRYPTAQEFSNALAAACRDANDITVVPPAAVPGKGSNATWTATMLAGESLVSTNSGTSGTSATSSSIVTQELELVYWKDIKESVDVEDIQGFLAKFPSGIYADLARRRLKKLGVSGDESDVGTRSGTVTQLSGSPTPDRTGLQAGPAGDADEKTADKTDLAWQALEAVAAQTPSLPLGQALPSAAADADPDATRLGTAAPAVAAVSSPAPAEVAAAPAAAAPVAASATAKPKTALMAGAAIAVLAAAGIAYKLMSPSAPSSPADPASAMLAASAPAAAASAAGAPAPAASMSASAPAAPASSPQAAASAQATARAAAAKKAAADKEKDKDKAAKPAPAKTASAASPSTSHSTDRPATAAPAAAATPQQACEGRMLLGYQTCMSEQCAKPAFANTAICVERRAIEQRREAERLSR
ncbi:MAG: serine/threonine protein kinase [Polaromonas sp.]|uniref:serine/threonine-protein kinase n=1 Tax=Polaromonas sp. TaxID=1869339 RepID=UPI0025EA667F|nr:serine/threonine-protein kinase [Polaromonas sp.]MBI2726128.1 serine/threonine protein kinase [Polaromonas sp.]